MTFSALVCINSQMSVLILLLLVQFTSLLDGAIVQQEQLRSVDDAPMRFQRQESSASQQCLDTGVTNLTETDPICANNIEGFLSAARSQPENFSLPQDVIDGICQCYNSLSEIYYNCTGALLNVSLN